MHPNIHERNLQYNYSFGFSGTGLDIMKITFFVYSLLISRDGSLKNKYDKKTKVPYYNDLLHVQQVDEKTIITCGT